MKLKFFYIFLFCFLSPYVRADYYEKCVDSADGNQRKINQCARDSLEMSENEMNGDYHALLAKEKNNAVFIKKIRIAQEAWLKFRDAELEAMYSCSNSDGEACWGNMLPMLQLNAWEYLNKTRTKQLRELPEQQQPAGSDQ